MYVLRILFIKQNECLTLPTLITDEKHGEMAMDNYRKEIRNKICDYFKKVRVKHTVRVFKYQKYQMVDVEYEDYMNEDHVLDDVHKLAGPEFLVNVKRECSDELVSEIKMYILAFNRKSGINQEEQVVRKVVRYLLPKYERSWVAMGV